MKRLKKISLLFMALLLVLTAGFFVYVHDVYPAQERAVVLLEQENITEALKDVLMIEPKQDTTTGLIFYPGAKVEYTAYLPLLTQLSEAADITIYLVKMPFNLAILSPDKAQELIDEFSKMTTWYLAGHSMGGAMASYFASNHEDLIKGVILLGAYPYGDYPLTQTLTIYGSLNTSVADKIDYEEQVVVIEGGNHAQFGDYGDQKGDAVATISREDQQQQAIDAIVEFLKQTNQ